jgi:hypothetical protein
VAAPTKIRPVGAGRASAERQQLDFARRKQRSRARARARLQGVRHLERRLPTRCLPSQLARRSYLAQANARTLRPAMIDLDLRSDPPAKIL